MLSNVTAIPALGPVEPIDFLDALCFHADFHGEIVGEQIRLSQDQRADGAMSPSHPMKATRRRFPGCGDSLVHEVSWRRSQGRRAMIESNVASDRVSLRVDEPELALSEAVQAKPSGMQARRALHSVRTRIQHGRAARRRPAAASGRGRRRIERFARRPGTLPLKGSVGSLSSSSSSRGSCMTQHSEITLSWRMSTAVHGDQWAGDDL